jgi:hypothetical protein
MIKEKTENDDIYPKNEEKKCFISIGECSSLYLYILWSGCFKLLTLIILGQKQNNDKGFGLFGFSPIMNNYNFIQSILTYLGYILFGTIFYFWKRKINIKNEIPNTFLEKSRIKRIKNIKKASKLFIILVCFTVVFYIESLNILYIYGFQFLDYWPSEIIFYLFFLKKYFKIEFYLHQKISILFIVTVCSIMLLIASFLPTSLSDDNPGNAYENVQNKFGNYFYCIPFILLFFLMNFIYSFSRTYSKILFQINFISTYILIIFIGIIGFIICFSASLISYKYDYYDNLISYFNDLGELLNKNEKYMFYSEIFLVCPLYAFGKFMQLLFEMLIIYHLNPLYVLITNNLCYGISKLVNFIISGTDNLPHFIFAELTEVLAVLGYLVYLEIFELNFCGLNENLRTKIIEKGENEFIELSTEKKNRLLAEDEGSVKNEDGSTNGSMGMIINNESF